MVRSATHITKDMETGIICMNPHRKATPPKPRKLRYFKHKLNGAALTTVGAQGEKFGVPLRTLGIYLAHPA